MSKIFDEFKASKFAVNCRTENEAREFVDICKFNDIHWINDPAERRTFWEEYKNQTCYMCFPDTLRYSDRVNAKIRGYKIITFNAFKNYMKEEKEMCSNGKLNKGIENDLVQDVYRAVQKPNGSIEFNKVKMVNLCFVKFDGLDKIYTFINPTDKRLEEGTKVLVDSAGRNSVAYVVSSIKIQKKYIKELMYAMSGKKGLELKNVLGILETKEILYKFGE